jgi:hypothetical protein
MPFKIKVVEVNIEEVRNGKNKYDKAAVVYSFNGQNRTQNIMSFSNPGIFAKVRTMKPGEEYNVEVTKNDKGFNQWASVESTTSAAADAGVSVKAGAVGSARTNVSTYETPEERKVKQLYIIRQSSISNAIEYCKQQDGAGQGFKVNEILDVAQQFVDFVYQTEDLFKQPNDLETDDVPY